MYHWVLFFNWVLYIYIYIYIYDLIGCIIKTIPLELEQQYFFQAMREYMYVHANYFQFQLKK